MTDLNRPPSPSDPHPSIEVPERPVTEREAHPSTSEPGSIDELSYDQRAAAAIEAVRQLEAHLAGRTPR